MDLKTLSLEALKALAYDQIVQLEQVKINLQAINVEIASRKSESNQQSKS